MEASVVMLELLVPAGSPEAVTAAVQNGADAVYLSFDELTGCRQAVNFSDDAFEAAVPVLPRPRLPGIPGPEQPGDGR